MGIRFNVTTLVRSALLLLVGGQLAIVFYALWPWHAGLTQAVWGLVIGGGVLLAFILACLFWLLAWFRRTPVEKRSGLLTAGVLIVLLPLLNATYFLWLPTPERMVTAALQGDVATVQRCLDWGIDPDATYEMALGFGGRAQSPVALWRAAEAGRVAVMQVLVEAGADARAEDAEGRSVCGNAWASTEVGAYLDTICR